LYLNNFYIIIILLISLSCSDQKGWGNEGVGDTFTIKRQKSYFYSEMLSGDLDSTEKIEFDNYKERIAEIKENELDNKNTNIVKEKKATEEKFNTVLSALYNLYKKFIGLFK
tara:strand:+ start:304 stop:639 length:336 start_codon:yes stop_codon:yes gene_type:complete